LPGKGWGFFFFPPRALFWYPFCYPFSLLPSYFLVVPAKVDPTTFFILRFRFQTTHAPRVVRFPEFFFLGAPSSPNQEEEGAAMSVSLCSTRPKWTPSPYNILCSLSLSPLSPPFFSPRTRLLYLAFCKPGKSPSCLDFLAQENLFSSGIFLFFHFLPARLEFSFHEVLGWILSTPYFSFCPSPLCYSASSLFLEAPSPQGP